MSKHDLEDRLVQFTVAVMQLAEQLPNSKIGHQLSLRMIKSSSTASSNYARAQSAENRKFFVRQLKLVLKELRKTNDSLKAMDGLSPLPDFDSLHDILKETDELIAIFVTSVRTAMQNDALAKRFLKKVRIRKDK